MNCPHCHREIPDTAVRCRYCKRAIKEDENKTYLLGDILTGIKEKLSSVLLTDRRYTLCPWTLLDVLAITILIVIFVFHDPFRLGANTLRFLRLHFFIFTKEPKLLYYLTVYINTILLKFVSLVYLVVLIRSRKVSFRLTVLDTGSIPRSWGIWMPVYIGMCFLMRLLSLSNPLVPKLPFNSVFPEAFIIGNIVVIFSVLFVAPVIEEILFRGFIFPAFNKYLGIHVSVLLTSILFTMAHYPQVREDHMFMGIIFMLSIIITYAKARTGSTKLAIIMHHLYNLVSVSVGVIDYLIVKY